MKPRFVVWLSILSVALIQFWVGGTLGDLIDPNASAVPILVPCSLIALVASVRLVWMAINGDVETSWTSWMSGPLEDGAKGGQTIQVEFNEDGLVHRWRRIVE